jgi:hypothetical protein
VYRQILINAKLKTGNKRGQKTELTGRSPLRRRRFALDCSVIEEEEVVEQEEEEVVLYFYSLRKAVLRNVCILPDSVVTEIQDHL